MKSQWNDAECRRCVDEFAPRWGEELALRVYTSRLIGRDPELVLHGGGNTSLKAPFQTLLGEQVDALYVKGSGASLDSLGPEGLPAVELAPLRRLRALPSLGDEEMVNELRRHLFDASAPTPSVEALLHAFLPHRFVDHSHADAILALTNQPHGESTVREALGERVAVLPFIMPGFPLAQAVAEAVEKQPDVVGVVLLKHGLFSFGEDARTSYERHIDLVDLAERHLERRAGGRSRFTARTDVDDRNAPARVSLAAPILRGLLAESSEEEDQPWRRFVLDWRGDEEVLAFCGSDEARTLHATGPLTPDHVIRTKARPVYLEHPAFDEPDRLRNQLKEAVARFRDGYERYFAEQSRAKGVVRTPLDSAPRVVLLPGAGALCFGRTAKDARIAADITVHTLRTKGLARAVGGYEALPDADLFDMEYWSLEQAKLGTRTERPLESQIVLITGGAGAIGMGVGRVCAAAGAHVVLADVDLERAQSGAAALQQEFGRDLALAVSMDVTDDASVREGFDRVATHYGGVDVLVANAGIARVAPLEDLSTADARRVAEVNYLGVLITIREAARVFRLQGLGGNVIVNASKNVFAPGKDFGAYSASKAAAHQLGKVAALELASHGVRVNFVNADAIFEEGDVKSGLWETVGPDRARSRGLEPDELPEFYRGRNLLGARIRARHVGNAVVFFASNRTPTTGATLPVDGGIPEAFPR